MPGNDDTILPSFQLLLFKRADWAACSEDYADGDSGERNHKEEQRRAWAFSASEDALKELQTKQNYTDVMRYFTGLVNFLISRKKLFGSDAEIMAAQLCLPVTVWINLCDREPEREKEIVGLIERHIRAFFRIYGKWKCCYFRTYSVLLLDVNSVSFLCPDTGISNSTWDCRIKYGNDRLVCDILQFFFQKFIWKLFLIVQHVFHKWKIYIFLPCFLPRKTKYSV